MREPHSLHFRDCATSWFSDSVQCLGIKDSLTPFLGPSELWQNSQFMRCNQTLKYYPVLQELWFVFLVEWTQNGYYSCYDCGNNVDRHTVRCRAIYVFRSTRQSPAWKYRLIAVLLSHCLLSIVYFIRFPSAKLVVIPKSCLFVQPPFFGCVLQSFFFLIKWPHGDACLSGHVLNTRTTEGISTKFCPVGPQMMVVERLCVRF